MWERHLRLTMLSHYGSIGSRVSQLGVIGIKQGCCVSLFRMLLLKLLQYILDYPDRLRFLVCGLKNNLRYIHTLTVCTIPNCGFPPLPKSNPPHIGIIHNVEPQSDRLLRPAWREYMPREETLIPAQGRRSKTQWG